MADMEKENKLPTAVSSGVSGAPLLGGNQKSFRKRYPGRCRINMKRRQKKLPKEAGIAPCRNKKSNATDTPPEKRGRFLSSFTGKDGGTKLKADSEESKAECQARTYEHRTPTDYAVGKLLGRGKFGRVYRATEKFESGRVVALKILQKKQVAKCQNSPFLLRREVEIHCRLRHPNILHQFGYLQDAKTVYLVFEEASGGDLYKYLKSNRLSEPVASTCIRQVAAALAHIQKLNVSHRDVKPENVLLTSAPTTKDGTAEAAGHFKLCDFGWAVHAPFPKHHMRETFCGTPEYLAPEMLLRNDRGAPSSSGKARRSPLRYDCRYVDTWTLGVLAFEVVFGQTPFCCTAEERNEKLKEQGGDDVNQKQLDTSIVFDKIRQFGKREEMRSAIFRCCGKRKALVEKEFRYFAEFQDLVQKLMLVVPSARMSLGAVGEHPWIILGS